MRLYLIQFHVAGGAGGTSDSKAMSLQPARTLGFRIVLLRFWIKSGYHDLSVHCCYYTFGS